MTYVPGRLRLANLAAAPASPAAGEMYYDTALNQDFVWNGTAWVPGSSPGFTTGPTTLPSSGLKDGQRMIYRLASNTIYRNPALAVHWDLVWDPSAWWYIGGPPLMGLADAGDVSGFGTSTWTSHPSINVTIPEKGVYLFGAYAEAYNATSAGAISMRVQFKVGGVDTFSMQTDVQGVVSAMLNLEIPENGTATVDKASIAHLQFFSPDSTMKVRRAVLEIRPMYILA